MTEDLKQGYIRNDGGRTTRLCEIFSSRSILTSKSCKTAEPPAEKRSLRIFQKIQLGRQYSRGLECFQLAVYAYSVHHLWPTHKAERTAGPAMPLLWSHLTVVPTGSSSLSQGNRSSAGKKPSQSSLALEDEPLPILPATNGRGVAVKSWWQGMDKGNGQETFARVQPLPARLSGTLGMNFPALHLT